MSGAINCHKFHRVINYVKGRVGGPKGWSEAGKSVVEVLRENSWI